MRRGGPILDHQGPFAKDQVQGAEIPVSLLFAEGFQANCDAGVGTRIMDVSVEGVEGKIDVETVSGEIGLRVPAGAGTDGRRYVTAREGFAIVTMSFTIVVSNSLRSSSCVTCSTEHPSESSCSNAAPIDS